MAQFKFTTREQLFKVYLIAIVFLLSCSNSNDCIIFKPTDSLIISGNDTLYIPSWEVRECNSKPSLLKFNIIHSDTLSIDEAKAWIDTAYIIIN